MNMCCGLFLNIPLSAEALHFRILPITDYIKINKQLIDRPCFQFRLIISGVMLHSREDTFKLFPRIGPCGSSESAARNYQKWEKKNSHRCIIVLFFFAAIFRSVILTSSITLINVAKHGGLKEMELAVCALTPWRERFSRFLMFCGLITPNV